MLAYMRMVPLICGLAATGALIASDAYPPPQFTDPQRVKKLEAAMPEVDRILHSYATEKKIPGMVWGVVIDGRLAHTGTFGVRDRTSNAPVTAGTAFRIASMTKSFTALAILKLRDEGKLSLEDPVAKWIPEFARMELPTRDTPPLPLRQLLSHSAGFPEDNPWGDQQLSVTAATLDEWLREGIPFSTPPGTRYEYSNYAFGLLGRVVAKAAGMPYEKYMQREILSKLRMDGTTYEFVEVPAASRAVGYRLKPDGTYSEEPPLPHGVFGSMGGLLTTATDLGRYVAFHLSAWPPRDDGEAGPVNRALVQKYYHHDGAYICETSPFWGGLPYVPPDHAGYYIGHYFTSILELSQTLVRVLERGAVDDGVAGFRVVHGMAARVRGGYVRDGDANLFGASGGDQPGVGRHAQNGRVKEARTAADSSADADEGTHPEFVEEVGRRGSEVDRVDESVAGRARGTEEDRDSEAEE